MSNVIDLEWERFVRFVNSRPVPTIDLLDLFGGGPRHYMRRLTPDECRRIALETCDDIDRDLDELTDLGVIAPEPAVNGMGLCVMCKAPVSHCEPACLHCGHPILPRE